MNKIDHKLAGALACLCLSGPLAAQGGKSLGEVSVLATPIVEANHIGDFSGFSTTVSAEQIRDLGALDLAAALRMTPGVQISRYNEVGSYSGDQGGNVYIRGLGVSRPGSEIKTYIDGLPVYMGVWNHPLIDLLPLNGMQRVSVQKGPDGMQNGNNFAAVNLETRRAREDGIQGEIQASVGTMATRVVQTSVVGRQQGLDFMLAAGHVHSNGDRQNSDGELNNAIGRLNLQLNAQWSAQLGFLSVGNRVGDPGDNRYPVSSTPVGPYSFSNGVARNQSQTTMLHAGLSHRHGDWQGELKIFENRGENNLLNDASWGTFDSSFVMSGLRWKESWSPWRGGRLTAGLDWDRVSGKVSGPHVGSPVGTPFGFGVAGTADVPEFRLLSPYVGLSQQFDLSRDWVLQPSLGLRYYESNIYPARTAPQAGVSLISEALTLYANHVHGLLYPGAETYTLTRAIPMAFAANNGWDRLSPSEDKHSEIGAKWQLAATTRLDFSVFEDR
ncbi:MAG: hypothetical protein RIR00_856, partial [Pseudomonadota bacterium]